MKDHRARESVTAAWTTDELSIPDARELVETVVTDQHVYHLMHDTGPNRWYVVRVALSGGRPERTVVYSSNGAPALKALWAAVSRQARPNT